MHFTFGSLTHFELIFVKSVRSGSRFIFWHMGVQLFQHHLSKDYLCSIVENQFTTFMWVCFCSLLLFNGSILAPVPHCFYCCSFTVHLEVRERESYFLCRLIRRPGSPKRRKESGALGKEKGVWNSQGEKDKHFLSTCVCLSQYNNVCCSRTCFSSTRTNLEWVW